MTFDDSSVLVSNFYARNMENRVGRSTKNLFQSELPEATDKLVNKNRSVNILKLLKPLSGQSLEGPAFFRGYSKATKE
jgi:hypothetical protein